MLEKAGLVLIGVILSVIVYFLKRWIEKAPQRETLEKHQKLLDINKQMNEQGVTPEDLMTLEAVLNGKAHSVEKLRTKMESETKPLLMKEEGEFITQAEMNIRANENFEIAKKNMENILNELQSNLNREERKALDEAQIAWESYSMEQAQSAAISYQGGSIYPLIYMSELESTTIDRAARLQAELDELRRLGN